MKVLATISLSVAIALAVGVPADAAISVVNAGSLRDTTAGTVFTKSFTAGNADKLVVSLATESGSAVTGVTYGGAALTLVPGSGGARNRGIWVLDDPTVVGSADVVVTGDGPFNSMGIGIVSLAGAEDGYTNVARTNGSSVALSVSRSGSFVFANVGANNGVIPTPAHPLVEIWRGELSSAEGAAAYAADVASGTNSFSFSGSLTTPDMVAVAFAPDSALPTLNPTDIHDDRGGGPIEEFTSVVYSLTFNERMDPATLTAIDVSNAATSPAPIEVGAITPVNATNFTIVVTPLDAGNLQLQIGSNVTDWAGNPMGVAVQDDTTIVVTNDLVAPAVIDIVDHAPTNAVEALQAVVFTVAFSETMDASSIEASDFVNASNTPIVVDAVTPGVNPNSFDVQVTPQAPGFLQLRVLSGGVTDRAGNALAADADDDTVLTVDPDTTLPTLAPVDVVDDVSGGPVRTNTLVTYTVTFSEHMNSNTVSAADFSNAGDAGVAIGAVSVSGPGTDVFTVPVTTLSPGSLQLQVTPVSVLEDLAGNVLNTNSAIADATVIRVDDTPPAIIGTVPADNAMDIPQTPFLEVTFDEDIVLGAGTITVYNVTLDSVFQTIDVTDSSQVAIAGKVLTVTPTNTLAFSTEYAVRLDVGVVSNRVGFAFAGIAGNDWSFTTVSRATYVWTQGGNPDNWVDPANWLGGAVPPRNTPGTVVIFGPNSTGQIAGEPPNGKVTVGELRWERSFELRDFGTYSDKNTGIYIDSGTNTPATAVISGGANLIAYYVNWDLATSLALSGRGILTVRAYGDTGVKGAGGFVVGPGVEIEFDPTHGSHLYTYAGGVTIRSGGLVDVDSNNGALGDGPLAMEEGAQVQLHNSALDNDVSVLLTSAGSNPPSNTPLMSGGGASLVVTGEFSFEVSEERREVDSRWHIVNATATYGAAFSVKGFDEKTPGVWTGTLKNAVYEFNESTGILRLVGLRPEALVLILK